MQFTYKITFAAKSLRVPRCWKCKLRSVAKMASSTTARVALYSSWFRFFRIWLPSRFRITRV